MFVYLKQSGELLASQGEPGQLWTPEGVRASTEKVATAWRYREELGMRGLTLVSGAGNIIRGAELQSSSIANGYADVLGRLGTVQNTLVLAAALEERNVATRLFIAANMRLEDGSIGGDGMQPFSMDGALEAHEQERVVLIAGGTGEDGKTTDNAVLAYAAQHATHANEEEVVVLKGTKYDGVYDSDPAKNSRAKRYRRVTAGYMHENFERMGAVDKSALETINDTSVAMRVYRDNAHDLITVIRNGDEIGTLIVQGSAETEPELAV